MRHHILYIPGLGDHFDSGRLIALKGWRLFGVSTELVAMQWYAGGSYEDKLELVCAAASRAQDADYTVSLVGESAGASMALHAAGRIKDLHAVITLAGITSTASPVSPHIKVRSPSFAQSVALLPETLKRLDTSIIHIVQALWDPTVPARYNQVKGATVHTVWSLGHITTVIFCITMLSFFIVGLVKGRR